MNKSHYLRLLRYDPLVTLVFLFGGAWLAWTDPTRNGNDNVIAFFFANGPFNYFLIGMAIPFIFNIPFGDARTPRGMARDAEVEFLFSRAVSRSSVFYAKASRYLFVCLFPVMIAWGFACARPEMRVQLSFDPAKRPAMEQFYLSHFPGSHVETDPADKYGNLKAYAVLPQGRMDRAFCATALICLTALLYQFSVFLFWRKHWAAVTMFLIFASVPNFSLLWMGSRSVHIGTPFIPTAYESSVGWMTMHVPLTLLGIGLLAIVTQTYSCRRYINTEVIP